MEVAAKIIKQKEKMHNDKSNFEHVWQEISEFVLPNRGDFTVTRSKGDRADARVFDTTAVHANEMLAAAIHSGLTSPESRWFYLRTTSITKATTPVAKWIERATEIMEATFADTSSGFYQQNHEFLLDLVAYGTSCMYVDEDITSGVRFVTRHMSEISAIENSKGKVDTVARDFCFTARQAEQEWGEDKLPRKMKTALTSDPQKKFDIVHFVMPRKDAMRIAPEEVNDIAEDREFIAFYIAVDDKHVLDVSGFYENPYLVVRWEKMVGDVYGRSPAWNSLSDIRMINVMSETIIRAAQKQVDPPLLVADDGVIMPLETRPSGINVGGVSFDGRPLIQPLNSGARVDIGLEMMEQRREAILRSYFVDQFIRKQGTPVTATEAQQNQQNSLRLTGPQLNRVQTEYLGPLIDRVFAIHQRSGRFPEAPEELAEQNLAIEYTSPLAKNQRSQELFSLNRAIQSASILIESNPEVLDVLDADAHFKDSLKIAGVPASSMRSDEDVQGIRQQRAQQQQQQQQTEQVTQGAETVAKLKSAGVDV